MILIPLTCVAFTWIGVRASGAFFSARQMRKENDEIERKFFRLQQQNQRIEREVKVLQSPTGVQRAARRLGWVKPGEVRLRIPEN